MTVLSRLCRIAVLLGLAIATSASAEDGYDLWLRYVPVETRWMETYRAAATQVVSEGSSPTLNAAASELVRGLGGLLDRQTPAGRAVAGEGALVIGTPASSPLIAGLHLPLDRAGTEGYVIRGASIGGRRVTVIAAASDVGVLYGSFAYLRLMQTRQPLDRLDIVDAPRTQVRILDHWDNLDGSIERGYAGSSLWKWQVLPGHLSPRYTDYARANASIGINGMVPNNVNSSADTLSSLYLEKTAALARAFRPYGIRVYLSPRFTAPQDLGHLVTSDPADPQVIAWWQAKVEEIYRLIPDFGGFLVKASSENQPGPAEYGRSHAEGANMFADLLKAHGGIVMYRAFVYEDSKFDQKQERVVRAYRAFKPLDGQFRDNVIVQVKDGPFDFQPREPFHPLFGDMPKTSLMVEFPITKEYLGQAPDLVYLGVRYQEFLQSDTRSQGAGSTVAKVIDGRLYHQRLTGMAGVSNIGSDRDWTGSIFNQANWYAFGRFAWNPDSTAQGVATEWADMTFTSDPAFVRPVVDMMLKSYEAYVDYSTPLGLAFMKAYNTHFGPGPWATQGGWADWTSNYFNQANADGIGFDRTSKGSNLAGQYHEPWRSQFEDLAKTPERYLLFFHRLRWDYRMRSGLTLFDDLYYHYQAGVGEVDTMRRTWAGLSGYVDDERFRTVADYLDVQKRDAVWWRDGSLAYMQSFAKLPFPDGYKPKYPLDFYKGLPPGAAPD
jgi:alpha-glucuronidase